MEIGQDTSAGFPVELGDYITQAAIVGGNQPNLLTQIMGGGQDMEVTNEIPEYSEMANGQQDDPAAVLSQQYSAQEQYAGGVDPRQQATANQQYNYGQSPSPVNYQQPNPANQYYYAAQPSPQSPAPVNQPYPVLLAPPQGAWSSHLFDCFDELPLWLYTFLCPCVVFGQIAEIVDKGSSTCSTTGAIYGLILGFSGCQSVYSCTYRTKMRHQYGIPGDDIDDYCTHCLCESCALFQEYKHLQSVGYDVPLGWYGQRQAQGVQMAPVAPNKMTR